MGFAVNAVRACMLLAVLTLVFAPLEHIFAVRPGSLFAKGWRVNLGWYFFNRLFTALLLGPPALLIAWLITRVCRAPLPKRRLACRYGRAWSRP